MYQHQILKIFENAKLTVSNYLIGGLRINKEFRFP